MARPAAAPALPARRGRGGKRAAGRGEPRGRRSAAGHHGKAGGGRARWRWLDALAGPPAAAARPLAEESGRRRRVIGRVLVQLPAVVPPRAGGQVRPRQRAVGWAAGQCGLREASLGFENLETGAPSFFGKDGLLDAWFVPALTSRGATGELLLSSGEVVRMSAALGAPWSSRNKGPENLGRFLNLVM